MANIEDDLKREVNIKKVVKAVKSIGSFALYKSSEDSTLLLTSYFILNLNEEQAWEMQCALLVKELGKWYTTDKDGPIMGAPVKQEEINLYYATVNSKSLDIIGFTELYLNSTALYAHDRGYVGFKREQIDMLGALPVIRMSAMGSVAVVSDFHVLTPVKKVESDYLAPLLF